ncbi:MAG: hypothetical protein OEM38_05125, partial [Gammaproteobacteria bacterium]|nr:hypothetical protein [Gammaproteobacteria bacterium]
MADIYSDIKLEQYVLNELSVEEARKLECAANSNEALRKRLEAIQYSNTAIESSINEQEVLREINYRIKNNKIRNEQQKTKKNRHSSWGRLAYAMPIVA